MTLKLFLATAVDKGSMGIILALGLVGLVIIFVGYLVSSEIREKLDEIKDILTKKDK